MMTTQTTRAALAAGFLIAALGAGHASAAEPAGNGSPRQAHQRGFSLGLQYQANFTGAEDPGPGSAPNQLFIEEAGNGLTFLGGYGFTPHFAMRLTAGTAAHRTTQAAVEVYQSSVVLEAHYRFLPGERARPYVFGGLGGTDIRADQEGFHVQTSGALAALGVGVLYDLTGHLAADLTARLDLINWNSVKVTQDLPDGSTVRLENPIQETGSAGKLMLGLVWQF
ncbi:MAG: porin family protein [Candidatus Eisenbacteria bacterium]|nr:porin family protein [Candidatus Eisenbacteria bacterium]